jgi:hypothetical protein
MKANLSVQQGRRQRQGGRRTGNAQADRKLQLTGNTSLRALAHRQHFIKNFKLR